MRVKRLYKYRLFRDRVVWAETMADTRKRSTNWSESERMLAVPIILENYNQLFGKFKSSIITSRTKGKTREEVQDIVNASSTTRRSIDDLKKMFQNMKQRAKEKNSNSKKTGGGPAPKITQTEKLILEFLADSPQLDGVDGGLETDPQCEVIRTVMLDDAEVPSISIHETVSSNASAICGDIQGQSLEEEKDDEFPRKSSAQGKFKRKRNSYDELYDKELTRAALEIILLQNRIAHEKQLFDRKLKLVEIQLQSGNGLVIPFGDQIYVLCCNMSM